VSARKRSNPHGKNKHSHQDITTAKGCGFLRRNKIGIAILVLGIAFFVKYAIDKNWINELGRVSIGLFCGVLLTVLAYKIWSRFSLKN